MTVFTENISTSVLEVPRLRRCDLRKARMKQRQLAALAGVSEPHLSLVLSGRREPGPRLLRAWREFVIPRLEQRRYAISASRPAEKAPVLVAHGGNRP